MTPKYLQSIYDVFSGNGQAKPISEGSRDIVGALQGGDKKLGAALFTAQKGGLGRQIAQAGPPPADLNVHRTPIFGIPFISPFASDEEKEWWKRMQAIRRSPMGSTYAANRNIWSELPPDNSLVGRLTKFFSPYDESVNVNHY